MPWPCQSRGRGCLVWMSAPRPFWPPSVLRASSECRAVRTCLTTLRPTNAGRRQPASSQTPFLSFRRPLAIAPPAARTQSYSSTTRSCSERLRQYTHIVTLLSPSASFLQNSRGFPRLLTSMTIRRVNSRISRSADSSFRLHSTTFSESKSTQARSLSPLESGTRHWA